MKTQKIKVLASKLGKLLGVVGLLFVLYKLYNEYTLDTFFEQFISILNFLPELIVMNILSTLLGIYAWHMMLLQYASKPFSYLVSYYYFAKTEIAKYLPGNVFHFVGRQALAVKMGIGQKEMAKISILFSIFLVTGTLLSSTLFAILSTVTPLYINILMLLSSLVVIIIIIFLFPSFSIYKKVQMNILLFVSVSIQGIMLGLLIFYQSPKMEVDLVLLFISIYIVSWLIGFVTPGASGGLGIREGTFIAISSFLHLEMSEDIIIFSVLVIRLINIFIDIIMYLSTYGLEKDIKENEILN